MYSLLMMSGIDFFTIPSSRLMSNDTISARNISVLDLVDVGVASISPISELLLHQGMEYVLIHPPRNGVRWCGFDFSHKRTVTPPRNGVRIDSSTKEWSTLVWLRF
eukprot:453160_1